eukprot:5717102-Prymnesium_polylepis.1
MGVTDCIVLSCWMDVTLERCSSPGSRLDVLLAPHTTHHIARSRYRTVPGCRRVARGQGTTAQHSRQM